MLWPMVQEHLLKAGSDTGPVPDLVRFIAGDFTPSVMAIWQGDTVADYLLASSAQRHVWHAVIATFDGQSPPHSELRWWLSRTRRKHLLREAFGNCPPGMVQLLSKLGPRSQTPGFYRAAYQAMNRRDSLSRVLQHSNRIDPRLVFEIAMLPTDPFTARLAGHALRSNAPLFQVAEICWLGRRVAALTGDQSVLNAVSGASSPFGVLRKMIAALPFPKAPWLVEGLVPIKNSAELAQVARELENCLTDHDQFYSACLDVQAGVAFYCQVQQPERLLLKFTRLGRLGWFLDECRGQANRYPSPQEIEQIIERLSAREDVWCERLNYQIV